MEPRRKVKAFDHRLSGLLPLTVDFMDQVEDAHDVSKVDHWAIVNSDRGQRRALAENNGQDSTVQERRLLKVENFNGGALLMDLAD